MRNHICKRILALCVLITVLAGSVSGRGVINDDDIIDRINQQGDLYDILHPKVKEADDLRVEKIVRGNKAQLSSRISDPSIVFIFTDTCPEVPGDGPCRKNPKWKNPNRYKRCGGALIHEEWVLTAAHCVYNTDKRQHRLMMGVVNFDIPEPNRQRRNVHQMITHEGYTERDGPTGKLDDIALIRLTEPVDMSKGNVRIATLAGKRDTFEGQKCVIAGWGRTGLRKPYSNHLLEVSMTQIPNAQCPKAINEKYICVFGRRSPVGERPTMCYGDSGGPMMCGDRLAGVGIGTDPSCSGDQPAVYTRVSEYRAWIARKTGLDQLLVDD